MAVRLGFGRHTAYVTETRARISSVLLAVFMTGVATSSLSRISIATLLFRFTANRKWRAVLWIIIAIQIVAVIAYVTVQLVQCRLVIAGTVLKPNTQCLKRTQVLVYNYLHISEHLVSFPHYARTPPSNPQEATALSAISSARLSPYSSSGASRAPSSRNPSSSSSSPRAC